MNAEKVTKIGYHNNKVTNPDIDNIIILSSI